MPGPGMELIGEEEIQVYSNMEQLLKLRAATAVACPFACYRHYAGESREIR